MKILYVTHRSNILYVDDQPISYYTSDLDNLYGGSKLGKRVYAMLLKSFAYDGYTHVSSDISEDPQPIQEVIKFFQNHYQGV